MPVKEWAWPGRARTSKQGTSFILSWPLYRLLAEGVAQTTGGSFHLKRSKLKVYLPISNDLKRKTSSWCPAIWVLGSHVDNQE